MSTTGQDDARTMAQAAMAMDAAYRSIADQAERFATVIEENEPMDGPEALRAFARMIREIADAENAIAGSA